MSTLSEALCDRPLADGTAPERVHLFPAGRIEGRDGRVFHLAGPAAPVAEVARQAVDLPMDVDHAAEDPAAARAGPVPAAGRIRELKADESGLRGRVAWTEAARRMIAAKEYRTLSPSFRFDKASRAVVRLKGAGLVHHPNLHLHALAAEAPPMDDDPDTGPDTGPDIGPDAFRARLARMLDQPEDAEPDELLAALAAAPNRPPDPRRTVPVAAVQSAPAERSRADAALSLARAEDRVETALRRGRITPAMRGRALDLARADAESFDRVCAGTVPAFAPLSDPARPAGPPARPRAGQGRTAAAVCRQPGLPPDALNGRPCPPPLHQPGRNTPGGVAAGDGGLAPRTPRSPVAPRAGGGAPPRDERQDTALPAAAGAPGPIVEAPGPPLAAALLLQSAGAGSRAPQAAWPVPAGGRHRAGRRRGAGGGAGPSAAPGAAGRAVDRRGDGRPRHRDRPDRADAPRLRRDGAAMAPAPADGMKGVPGRPSP
jgi:phage I-like protein